MSSIKKSIPPWLLSAYHWCLASLATLVYGFPSEQLTVIGVTGTDGKTTTCNLLAKILEQAGHKVGMSTTINFKIGEKEWPNTTKQGMQGRFKLQKFLRRLVRAKCDYAIIETTSEGIKQHRQVGINYDVAVFTNLTPEHIESHGSFENYKKAKGKLFKSVAGSAKIGHEKFSVINGDDPAADYFLSFRVDNDLVYTLDKPAGKGKQQLWATDIRLTPDGTTFLLQTLSGDTRNKIEIRTPLVGRFNVYNTLAAIAVAYTQKIDLETISTALARVVPPAGRMEIIDIKKPFTVIVDYAHTPNGLDNALKAVKPFVKGKLWSILGSQGGGRDKQKRPKLGMTAGRLADLVIVTNEDPYDESPQKIIDDVFAGALQAGKEENKNAWRILDREQAIKKALSEAQAGDIVLITGKGCETVIMGPAGKRIPWDDRAAVRSHMQMRL